MAETNWASAAPADWAARYQKYLGRAPDEAGLNYWRNLDTTSGMTDAQLSSAFQEAAAKELEAKVGSSNNLAAIKSSTLSPVQKSMLTGRMLLPDYMNQFKAMHPNVAHLLTPKEWAPGEKPTTNWNDRTAHPPVNGGGSGGSGSGGSGSGGANDAPTGAVNYVPAAGQSFQSYIDQLMGQQPDYSMLKGYAINPFGTYTGNAPTTGSNDSRGGGGSSSSGGSGGGGGNGGFDTTPGAYAGGSDGVSGSYAPQQGSFNNQSGSGMPSSNLSDAEWAAIKDIRDTQGWDNPWDNAQLKLAGQGLLGLLGGPASIAQAAYKMQGTNTGTQNYLYEQMHPDLYSNPSWNTSNLTNPTPIVSGMFGTAGEGGDGGVSVQTYPVAPQSTASFNDSPGVDTYSYWYGDGGGDN